MPQIRQKVTTFFLVRHGETPWTAERRYQGQSDTSLSSFGRNQAKALAKQIKKIKIDRIYTSALKRTQQTGKVIANSLKQSSLTDARLNEYHFGAWEGRKAKELMASKDPAFLSWCRGQWVNPPKGERLQAFKRRIRGVWKDLQKKHAGQNILLVSHGGPIKMLIFEALRMPFRSFWNLRIDTASISVLTCYPDFTQLGVLNDTSHLTKLNSRHNK